MRIYVASVVRGFLVELFNKLKGVQFTYNNKDIYEKLSKKKIILNKIARSSLFDKLGIIRVIRVPDVDSDLVFSYNKFLRTNRPYIIYLENPYALVNYSNRRNITYFGKKNLERILSDKNLKAIIGLSKASSETLPLVYDLPSHILVDYIPPLISNVKLEKEFLENRSKESKLKCLYISHRFELKGGADVLKTFETLKDLGYDNINIEIITSLNTISEEDKLRIDNLSNVKLSDFSFNKEELNEKYKQNNIILNPTRMDSFGMVLLEAMKYGVVPITTDLYAIPEFVKNNYNGFLTQPKFRLFEENNLPNDYIWNNREKTIYSSYLDSNIVSFMTNKLIHVFNNRDELQKLSINAYDTANLSTYSEEAIIKKWEDLFLTIGEKINA